eukprot:8547935-Pyramimonas_sp.AAC.1
MALQGFPISRLNFDVIAERYGVQVKDVLGALGNSMSINALMRLLPRLLKSGGLRRKIAPTTYDKLPLLAGSTGGI